MSRPAAGLHVEVRRDPDGSAARVSVIDDGQGMDEHTLSHALDPFFSAKPAGRRVGMGLPRAQQILIAHHGTLELRSTAGEGTVASFTLPLDCPSDPADTRV